MQFTDRIQLHTDRLRGFRSVRSLRIKKPYAPTLISMKISPINEIQFTDRIQLYKDQLQVYGPYKLYGPKHHLYGSLQCVYIGQPSQEA